MTAIEKEEYQLYRQQMRDISDKMRDAPEHVTLEEWKMLRIKSETILRKTDKADINQLLVNIANILL